MKKGILGNERFEIIGDLYYADTGFLRPGKSDPMRDTNDSENVERFEQWFATQAFSAAIVEIACLKALLEQIDTWSSCATELNMSNYDEDEVSELNEAMIKISLLF